MATRGNVLFTGSVGLEDGETVFRTLGETIGDRAKRYPDGETGTRHYWIRWLNQIFESHPDFRLLEVRKTTAGFKDIVDRPVYHFVDGADLAALEIESFGYAEAALASWREFEKLKNDGAVPSGTRFQVSIPTATAILAGFVRLAERAQAEAAVEGGLHNDVDKITAAIPADELAIQWDVCHEIVGHDGPVSLHYDNLLDDAVERICRHLSWVPEGVEAGIHLCYGDPGHQHIVEPESLATSVAFANAISIGSPRAIQWMHMPVPRGRADDAYFAPLADLQLRPETELFLGLVHHTDGVGGAQTRIATAEKYAPEFGIATECGFGRRPPETIPALLQIHADIADRG